ncbi:MAG TPA: hypothetical protein P5249_08405 [Smithellaceae bacterium]|nr:hypothetical protein [Smithellaceae bacterium]
MSVAGDDIDAYCTKCKLLLTHTVLSETGGIARNVQCKTCGAQHKYRRAPGARKASGSLRTILSERLGLNAAGKQPVSATTLWEIKNQDMLPHAAVREYSMQDRYKYRDVIQHPTFGLGFVEKIRSETSMKVLFRDAVKLMAMNIR